jgi:ABC-2 type transport system permease protein
MSAYFFLILANIRSAINYRQVFLSQSLLMVVNNAFLLLMWYFIFHAFGSVQGMNWDQYVLYFCLFVYVFSVAMILFSGMLQIGEAITEGKLDSFLVLPSHPGLTLIVSRTRISAFGDFMSVFLFFACVPWQGIGFYVSFFIFGFIAGGILAFFLAIFQSLAFIIGSSSELSRGIFDLLLG